MSEHVYAYGDILERIDNGRKVRIISATHERFSVLDTVFYITEDVLDGHTTILGTDQLRPAKKVAQ